MFCMSLLTQACTSLSQDVLCDFTNKAHVAQNAVDMFSELHAMFCHKRLDFIQVL